MASPTYTIRQLSEEFGVTPRALRFYEDKGLLAPRRQKQARIYSLRDRARLILILRGKRVGFSLDEIQEMLDLYDRPEGRVTQLEVSIAKFRGRIADLEEQRRDIDASIKELEESCRFAELRLEQQKKKEAEQAKDVEEKPRLAPSVTGFAGPVADMGLEPVTEMVMENDDL